MINFVFEDLDQWRNFKDSWVFNKAMSPRWTVAPIFNRLNILETIYRQERKFINKFSVNERPDKYIIALGVNNDPSNWAGGNYGEYKDQNYKSLFDFIPNYYLEDLQNNKAFLLIDSSFEGYHEDWIFDFFHEECKRFSINPKRIFFVTGNSIIEECYDQWLKENPQKDQIKVIPYSCFEFDTFLFMDDIPQANKRFPPKFNEHLIYKEINKNKLKTYCNLNKKTRSHRVNFYSLLHINNLLNEGLVSMNKFSEGGIEFCNIKFDQKTEQEIKAGLPRKIYDVSNEIHNPDYYVKRFNDDVILDTFVSVISEAQYEDHQKTVFLSEKIFKVIACSHPFIVLGNKNSLKELRKLGYLTFSPWIDETYDELSDCERYHYILRSLKKIIKIEDKIKWFTEMKEILEYNRKLLRTNSIEKYPYAVVELFNHYQKN